MVLWCHLCTWMGTGTSSPFFGGSPVPEGPVVVGRDGPRARSFSGSTVPAPGMRKSAVK